MPATYVTKAELRTNLGIGTLYADAVVEEVCQAAENLLKEKLWFNEQTIYAISASGTTGRIYIADNRQQFVVGDVVTIENVRQHWNGSKTLTKVYNNGEHYLEFVNAQITTREFHNIAPYGRVFGSTGVDYETLPQVREAAMLIAVDIWMSRQQSAGGGIAADFQALGGNPYRMGNTLMARVRGLIADYLHPGGLVG
jgi:hypothetical protein